MRYGPRAAVALLATLPMLAGLVTAPAIAGATHSADNVVPAFCPQGTVHSERLIDADFNPSATGGLNPWTSEPEDAFSARLSGEEWTLHGERTEAPYDMSVESRKFRVPQGRQIFLLLDHQHSFTDPNAAGFVDLDTYDHFEFLEFNDGYRFGGFAGSSYRRTSYVDITEFAGDLTSIRISVSSGRQATWDIYDLSVVTCDDAVHSGPTQVVSTAGQLGEARISWQPPVRFPEQVTGYTARLIDVADPNRNRTAYLTANARSWRFTGLTGGRTYRVEVGAGDRFSRDRRMLRGSRTTVRSDRTRTVTYGVNFYSQGSVECPIGDTYSIFSVLLQYRVRGTTTWKNAQRATAWPKSTGLAGWDIESRPTHSSHYRVLLTGGEYTASSEPRLCMGSTTSLISVTVKARVSLLVDGDDHINYYVDYGDSFKMHGSVGPNSAGRPIKLQRYYDGGWHTISTQTLNSYSRYSFTVRTPGRGDYRYRIYSPGHTLNAAGYSRSLPVRSW